jgi:hypothetical protein
MLAFLKAAEQRAGHVRRLTDGMSRMRQRAIELRGR